MSSFQRFVKTYLNFTSRERYGISGLLLLIALFHFLPPLLYSKGDYSKELAEFKTQIAKLDTLKETKVYSNSENRAHSSYTVVEFQPFYFDPNTVNPIELKKFGVPDYVIQRFTKYRNAGAKFKKKEDLKKLYGLKPEVYLKMEPFIQIELKANAYEAKDYKLSKPAETKNTPQFVELNTADSLSLLKVKGIGPYLSSKILRYRNALGGFINLDQLNEIFAIKPEQISEIKPYLTLDITKINFIDVNRADYYQLNAHPYISAKEAKAIIAYRQQHGVFNKLEDLEKIYVLNKNMIQKVSPYLKF